MAAGEIGRGTNQSGDVRFGHHRMSRRRFIAIGTSLLLLVAGGGAAAGAAIAGAFRPESHNKLTLSDIREAGQDIGQMCLHVTADGTTIRTGAKRGYTVARTFTGGISCRAVVRDGKIIDTSVYEAASESGSGSKTTYNLGFKSARQSGQGNAYAWGFYEGVAPVRGNVAGTAALGYVASNGSSQSWIVGATERNSSPDGPFDSSLQVGDTAGASTSTALFDDVVASMRSKLDQVKIA